MVPPPQESLNTLIEELQAWEHQLKHSDIDFERLEP